MGRKLPFLVGIILLLVCIQGMVLGQETYAYEKGLGFLRFSPVHLLGFDGIPELGLQYTVAIWPNFGIRLGLDSIPSLSGAPDFLAGVEYHPFPRKNWDVWWFFDYRYISSNAIYLFQHDHYLVPRWGIGASMLFGKQRRWGLMLEGGILLVNDRISYGYADVVSPGNVQIGWNYAPGSIVPYIAIGATFELGFIQKRN